jgi:hypothetical protein
MVSVVYFALLKSMDLGIGEGLLDGVGRDVDKGESTGEGEGGYSESVDEKGVLVSNSGDLGE